MNRFLRWIIPVSCILCTVLLCCCLAPKDTTSDYAAIERLIVSERLYRVNHRNEELAKCYAEDAEIHTSWQRGGVSSFVGQTCRGGQVL